MKTNKKATRRKNFYLHCIEYMTTITTLEEFTTILKAVFISSSLETDTVEVTNSRNKLMECIRTFKKTEIQNNYSEKYGLENEKEDIDKNLEPELAENELEPGFDDEMSHFVDGFSDEISEKIKEFSINVTDFQLKSNDFYLPSVVPKLRRLCYEYPCWTSVI